MNHAGMPEARTNHQPRPWRNTLASFFGRFGKSPAIGQESVCDKTQSSASFTLRNPASIFDKPPRLRSHPATCNLAAKASCESPASVRRRRTWGPTRFCEVAAIAPLLELDPTQAPPDSCSADGANFSKPVTRRQEKPDIGTTSNEVVRPNARHQLE